MFILRQLWLEAVVRNSAEISCMDLGLSQWQHFAAVQDVLKHEVAGHLAPLVSLLVGF